MMLSLPNFINVLHLLGALGSVAYKYNQPSKEVQEEELQRKRNLKEFHELRRKYQLKIDQLEYFLATIRQALDRDFDPGYGMTISAVDKDQMRQHIPKYVAEELVIYGELYKSGARYESDEELVTKYNSSKHKHNFRYATENRNARDIFEASLQWLKHVSTDEEDPTIFVYIMEQKQMNITGGTPEERKALRKSMRPNTFFSICHDVLKRQPAIQAILDVLKEEKDIEKFIDTKESRLHFANFIFLTGELGNKNTNFQTDKEFLERIFDNNASIMSSPYKIHNKDDLKSACSNLEKVSNKLRAQNTEVQNPLFMRLKGAVERSKNSSIDEKPEIGDVKSKADVSLFSRFKQTLNKTGIASPLIPLAFSLTACHLFNFNNAVKSVITTAAVLVNISVNVKSFSR